MNRKLLIGFVGLLVIGALMLVLTGTVLAQDETPTPAPDTKPFYGGPGPGRGFGHGFGNDVTLEAAAEALGMTADELSTQLWGGKTLADLADEKGVDLQDVRDAVQAAQEQAVRDAIEQAVTDGTLTREHADWLLEGLDKGFWGGHGMDMGGLGGCGGFRGHGGSRGHGNMDSFQDNTGFRGFQRFPGNNALSGTSGA